MPSLYELQQTLKAAQLDYENSDAVNRSSGSLPKALQDALDAVRAHPDYRPEYRVDERSYRCLRYFVASLHRQCKNDPAYARIVGTVSRIQTHLNQAVIEEELWKTKRI